MGGIVLIIVLLILPSDVLFQFLLRMLYVSAINLRTFSTFNNETEDLDKVPMTTEREAYSLYYISASMRETYSMSVWPNNHNSASSYHWIVDQTLKFCKGHTCFTGATVSSDDDVH